jgi:hypothetical protein
VIAEPGSEGAEKPESTLPTEVVDLPPNTRLRRGAERDYVNDPVVAHRIQITIVEPDPPRPQHPCQLGQHRWAYLTAGGQACGYCGVPRA